MNSAKMSPSGRAILVAQYAMEKTLAVKPKEQIMILADTEADSDLVHAFASVANIMGAEPTILIMPPAFLEMERFPTKVALKALEAADIYIPMTPTTGHSVHCLEVAELFYGKKAFRWLIVGGYHGGQMDAMLDAFRNHDYENVFNITKKVAEIINRGEKVRVTSKLGTNLTASIKNIACRIAGGLAREPGTSACIPDGEAYSGPAEGTTEGVAVIDGPISQICERPTGPSEPVRLTFSKGRLKSIEGGFEAEKLREIVKKYENADNIAEVSVGTNPYIRLTGNINSNDKKKWGTMHIALGQNVFQIYPHGTVDSQIHMDAMMLEPTCEIDGKIIVENGKITI